jgi:copper chaperone CopZ
VTSPSPSPSPSTEDGAVTVELAVEGMHCGSCAALIEEALGERSGVVSAAVDLDAARAVVDYRPSELGVDDLRATIAEVGYSAQPVS